MSSTKSILIKKLLAHSCEQKMIEAAERRDYAAVCFMLLKELSSVNEDIYAFENADKHNHQLHRKTCQKLKAAKEENEALKAKIKKQSFEKDVAQRGAQQMMGWYEQDDQIMRKEIDRLSASNIRLQNEVIELQQIKDDYAALNHFADKCMEHNGELSDEKEELRQQLGYTSVELEDAKRTIKKLEDTVKGLSVF
jgi:predicted O-linked N-acetylglucosamine transferase (SPINDLY family)